jgi:hypothetical protein
MSGVSEGASEVFPLCVLDEWATNRATLGGREQHSQLPAVNVASPGPPNGLAIAAMLLPCTQDNIFEYQPGHKPSVGFLSVSMPEPKQYLEEDHDSFLPDAITL